MNRNIWYEPQPIPDDPPMPDTVIIHGKLEAIYPRNNPPITINDHLQNLRTANLRLNNAITYLQTTSNTTQHAANVIYQHHHNTNAIKTKLTTSTPDTAPDE
jgi:hypothetical protein